MLTRRTVRMALPWVLVCLGCQPAERGDTGEIETAGSVDAFTMRLGDCFDDVSLDEIHQVPGVPCADPHDNQIYAKFDIDGAEWPGAERVDELATQGCMDRFEGAIGAPYPESVLEIFQMMPTEGSWDLRDDREVLCAAYHMEGKKLTGSVLGSEM